MKQRYPETEDTIKVFFNCGNSLKRATRSPSVRKVVCSLDKVAVRPIGPKLWYNGFWSSKLGSEVAFAFDMIQFIKFANILLFSRIQISSWSAFELQSSKEFIPTLYDPNQPFLHSITLANVSSYWTT